MAVRSSRGLGKGLESLIPNAVGEAKKKEAISQDSGKSSEEKGSETILKITMVEPNSRGKISMKTLYRNFAILSNR